MQRQAAFANVLERPITSPRILDNDADLSMVLHFVERLGIVDSF